MTGPVGKILERLLGGLLAGLVAAALGCGSTPPASPSAFPEPGGPVQAGQPPAPAHQGEVTAAAAELAKHLAQGLPGEPGQYRLAVATFVDLNDLAQTSPLGRSLSEALVTLLPGQGFQVVEVRKAANLAVRPKDGVFYLSQEAAHLAADHQVSAVVVGSYSREPNSILVTARIISAADGRILAAALTEMPLREGLSAASGGPAASAAHRVEAVFPQAAVPVYERPPLKAPLAGRP